MPQPRAVLLDGSYSDGEVNDLGNYTPENGDKPDRMMVQLTLASERSSPQRKSQMGPRPVVKFSKQSLL